MPQIREHDRPGGGDIPTEDAAVVFRLIRGAVTSIQGLVGAADAITDRDVDAERARVAIYEAIQRLARGIARE